MSHPCEDTGSSNGIFVDAWCGVASNRVCTLGSRTDVQHIVRVENLRGYPANIECIGEIKTAPNVVKFSSMSNTDTETRWVATKQSLDDDDSFTFAHVIILPELSGSDKVHASINYDIPEPEITGSINVSFDVTA